MKSLSKISDIVVTRSRYIQDCLNNRGITSTIFFTEIPLIMARRRELFPRESGASALLCDLSLKSLN